MLITQQKENRLCSPSKNTVSLFYLFSLFLGISILEVYLFLILPIMLGLASDGFMPNQMAKVITY